jgi:hypothetical protein
MAEKGSGARASSLVIPRASSTARRPFWLAHDPSPACSPNIPAATCPGHRRLGPLLLLDHTGAPLRMTRPFKGNVIGSVFKAIHSRLPIIPSMLGVRCSMFDVRCLILGVPCDRKHCVYFGNRQRSPAPYVSSFRLRLSDAHHFLERRRGTTTGSTRAATWDRCS